MVQTIIKPDTTHVHVEFDLPVEFIGREIKVTFSAVDEVPLDKPRKKMGDFLGILSDKSAKSLKDAIAKSREEWERDI